MISAIIQQEVWWLAVMWSVFKYMLRSTCCLLGQEIFLSQFYSTYILVTTLMADTDHYLARISCVTCKTCFAKLFQGQVVQKLVKANLGLKVNQSIIFSCMKMFFTAYVLCSLTNTVNRKPHRKVRKLRSKFSLILG